MESSPQQIFSDVYWMHEENIPEVIKEWVKNRGMSLLHILVVFDSAS